MTVDPQEVRAEPHTEIGHVLKQDVNLVLERWSRRAVEEQPHAKRVHHGVLLDHLREFLVKLGGALAESEAPFCFEHQMTAVVHGEQRWDEGWSLTEVVRDYQILRLVVLDYLEEALDRPLGSREVQAIGLALDEAITASVVSFVHERDEHLRQLHDERAETEKRSQRQLEEQTLALQDADRRKNEFLAILGHELRNPLASIYTALEIQRLKATDDPEVACAREVIERQVRQLTRLVDDLLDVSRITQGKVQLQLEPVDIATIVQRAVEMAQPLFDAQKHRLSVSLSREPMWVEADAARLTQVLTNLLRNAAKYTSPGGQIKISAECHDNDVIVRVRDNGIGIAPELLPRVFEPFIQVARSLDRSDGGLGLGLTLVRSLLELHQGTIEAHSEGKGKGSEFVVHLPAMDTVPTPAEAAPAAPEAERAAPRRILVVDDNRDGARTLSMLLQLDGHQVNTAHDGPAALETADAWQPDVVLLDIGLPGMDGLEVARRLRNNPQHAEVLLIAISGYGQDDDQLRSQEAGIAAHLVKPVDLAALQRLFASEHELLR